MIEKYFDDIETFEEINGHFNKNFKVKTNEGLFHLKVFKDGTSEIKKGIEGDTIKEGTTDSIKLLEMQLAKLSGKAEEMDLLNLGIDNFKYIALVSKYKNEPKVYCHNDLNKDNVVLDGNTLTLIDFEFARMNDKYGEYANIIVEDNVDIELFLRALPHLNKHRLEDGVFINRTYNTAGKRKHENN